MNDKIKNIYLNKRRWEIDFEKEIFNKRYQIDDKNFYLELQQTYFLLPKEHKKLLQHWRKGDEDIWTYNKFEIDKNDWEKLQTLFLKTDKNYGLMLYFGEWIER